MTCAYPLSYGAPCILSIQNAVHGHDAHCEHAPRNDCHPYQPPKEEPMPQPTITRARVVGVNIPDIWDDRKTRPRPQVRLVLPNDAPLPAVGDEVAVADSPGELVRWMSERSDERQAVIDAAVAWCEAQAEMYGESGPTDYYGPLTQAVWNAVQALKAKGNI